MSVIEKGTIMSDEKTPAVETKEAPKERKMPDMTKVREAKKRKQQERDTTLSVLQNQLSTMATMMKPDLKTVVESDDEDEGPMVVTRKKQKLDSDGPSLKSEIFKTALVGLLGVGTWYVQSVMFAPKQVSVLDKIAPPVIPPPVVPTVVTPAATSKPSPAPAPILSLPPKKKIGYSGLYE